MDYTFTQVKRGRFTGGRPIVMRAVHLNNFFFAIRHIIGILANTQNYKGEIVSRMRYITRLLSLNALAFPLMASAASAPPVDAFFQPAAVQHAALAPSARWMALLNGAPDGRNKLTVVDLDGREASKVVATFSKFDISNVRWVSDDYLVFSLSDPNAVSLKKPRYPGLLSVDREGKHIRVLIKFTWDTEFPAGGNNPLEPYNVPASRNPPGTNTVIVIEPHYGPGVDLSHVTLRSLNVATGAHRALDELPKLPFKSLHLDNVGGVIGGYTADGGKQTLHWRAPNGKWQELATFQVAEEPFSPAYIDRDQLYVSVPSGTAGTEAVHKFDFAANKPVSESIVETPGFDSRAGGIYEYGTNTLVGVSTEGDSEVITWFTPAMKNVQKKVDEMLPGRINIVNCTACINPKRVLIMSYADASPVEYLLYSVTDDKWQRIGASRPNIDPEQMAQLDMHAAKTRDGAHLPVWITATPLKATKPRPAVVLVHDGPWQRGVFWNWNPEAQFLASRGYVVIEPEFRGSKGYGQAHFKAGWKQWGQRMQDDVNDALRYAVDKGLVDGNRVCIAGGGYGGYSVLMGLAKDPALYRCGVAWLAITDPRNMHDSQWSDTAGTLHDYSAPALVGDPVKDADMLKAHAPILLAPKIKSPLLLAYGSGDPRISIDHGREMRKALAEAGNKPEWILYNDSEQSWSRPENKIDFWRRVEAFLEKNLK
ncbi:alpha/beta hydrolase family protein [Massilia sp. SM-13]|uniref:alpha/beta hydrolase family protein n=1 Tax=Pseudoduganella rhizocola TaxID=3382643 RepID=UPI0038B4391C